MATADTARLIASLELRDKFSAGVNSAITSVGRLETKFGKIGGIAAKGVSTAIGNIAKLGLIGAGVLTAGVKGGLDSLAQLEDATTAVDGAITQLGLTGKVTSKEVAAWANQIESDVGAAFDDKDITAAAATLIRYGKIAPANLKPAMVAMTDLATKTGSVESAGNLMAKALANPEKAAGKLAKAGIYLTDEQTKQIRKMQEAGDMAGAQALLLDDVTAATKGAAAASQGPYRTAMSTLKDAVEDAERALAIGFLPVIQEVATFLKTKLSDPKVIDAIKKLGTEGAGLLKDAFEGAKKIPWATIADAFKFMGTGAKAAFDIFSSMPEWVKTAVITGWGVNKLTGGALSGIITEIGKGLIKGVLGMTAGMVNVKAASVTVIGGAGVPGVVPGAIPGGPTSTAGKLLGIVSKVFIVGMAAELASEFVPKFDPASTLPLQQLSWPWGPRDTPQLTGTLADILGPNFLGGDAGMPTTLNTTLRDMDKSLAGWPVALGTSLKGALGTPLSDMLQKFDRNNDGILSLKEVVAGKLGISVAKLTELKQASGGWNATLAGKLGISNEKLQELRGFGHRTVDELGTSNSRLNMIKNKDWSPTIITKVASNFYVSARQIASQLTVYRTVSGRLGVGVE